MNAGGGQVAVAGDEVRTAPVREPIIEAEGARFAYGPGLPDVLRGVDLTVRRGDFLALLGQNGAGKTTLAKHFNGLHTPRAGQVRIAGRSTAGQRLTDLARMVGYCYQNPDHQIFSSSVEKEVRFGPVNLGFPADRIGELVEHALDLVGCGDLREAHPFTLGRGERQLVAVASVLAMDPPVLVIDEPTTGMDRIGATRVMELLAGWSAAGRTIVVITHDMDIVTEYVPRSVVMAGGRIVADGPTQAVFRDRDALARAHLVQPAPVVVSDRLAPAGVRPGRSIAEIAANVAARVGG